MTNYKPDIWRLQAQSDSKGLIEALKDTDPDYRKRAALALRTLGTPDAMPALRKALIVEQDEEVRFHIGALIEALANDTGDLVPPPAELTPVQRLIEKLKETDPQIVIDAANQLGEMKDKLAVEPLVVLFNDSNVSIEIRLAVAEALLKLEAAPVEVTLLAALRNSDWHIRRNGAAILGQLKAVWAVDPLAKALRDPNSIVRKTAFAALKHIGTPEARKAVLEHRARMNSTRTPETGQPAKGDEADASPKSKLLDRVKTPEEAPTPSEKEEDDPLSWPKREDPAELYLNPTQPLDPSALAEAEARRKKSTLSPPDAAKPDHPKKAD